MWPYSGEYQNKHVMVKDGKEFERVGEEWVRVEVRDPKQRSEEEKKIVQQVGSTRAEPLYHKKHAVWRIHPRGCLSTDQPAGLSLCLS
jgi:hypothetical protein